MLNLYISELTAAEKPHDGALRVLDYALLDIYNIRLNTLIIDTSQSGKPFFRDHDRIKFNLSHSGDYAAAVLSDAGVGLDIERIKPINPKITERYLKQLLRGDADRDVIEAWCRRESYGKFTGEGFLHADFKADHHIEILDCIPGYITAVCTAKKAETEIRII